MTVPPELDPELVEALRTELGAATPPEAVPPVHPGPRATGIAGFGGVLARGKSAARARLRPVVLRLADVVAHRLMQRGDLRELLAWAQVDEVHAATVNLELMKAELRAVVDRLEGLGQAIAPAAGLEGVAERFAELRERVNALDRRLRHVGHQPAGAEPGDGRAPAATTAASGDRFDYVGFEARFRGDSASVAEAQNERYLELLSAHPPVLDIGCGRGELLEALEARGVAASGVDLNAEMVAEARSRDLDVHRADAVEWLRGLPERSLGSIVTVHVVEHLELGPLIELLELASSRLVPGGVLVAETPNPASLIVLGNSYILDPTHVRPLHPSLLTFLCERAGFRDVDLRFYAPAEAYHLPRLDLDHRAPRWASAVDHAFAQLNHVLFGPQEYAVVATTPPSR